MTSKNRASSQRFLKKRWVKIAVGLIVLTASLIILIPVAAKFYLVDWLQKNGAEKASIEQLVFNPFAGRLTVGGVDVSSGGESLIKNSTMVLDVGITSLFKRELRVEKAEYVNFSIDLEQFEDGRWRIGSVRTPKSEGQPADDASEVAPDEAAESQWNFLADHVVLRNCTIKLKTVDLDFILHVKTGELQKLTTQAGKPAATFHLDGTVNGQPIVINLERLQIVPDLAIDGSLQVVGFDLNQLAGLLEGSLSTFKGIVGIDGEVALNMGEVDGLNVDFTGKLGIDKVNVAGSNFGTESDQLNWEGKVHFASKVNSPMVVQTDGLLAARDYRLELPGSELMTSESLIEFAGETELILGEQISVLHSGSLLVEGLGFQLPQTVSAQNESLSWKGTVDLQIPETDTGLTLKIDGALDGKAVDATLAGDTIRIVQDNIGLITTMDIGLGDNLDLRGKNALTLDGFKLFSGDQTDALVSFASLSLAELSADGDQKITVEGFVTEGLKARVAGDMPLDIDIPKIHMEKISTENFVAYNGEMLQVEQLSVTSRHNEKQLAGLQLLTVGDLTFDDQQKVTIAELQLDNLSILAKSGEQENDPAISLKKALLPNLSWHKTDGLAADRLSLDGLLATIIRDTEGNLNITTQLGEMQLSEPQPVEQPEQLPVVLVEESEPNVEQTTSTGMPLRMEELSVTGESAVVFEDHTLAVPYLTDIAIKELVVSDIDSTKPEQKTDILLKAELEKRAPLEITGFISPFQDKTALKMKVKLKNYPLSSLSAYTVQSVGTALASGQLKIKTKIELAEDELDMANTIVLKKLETTTISPDLAAELNNQLPIPLDAALSILRDSERNITLDIPLNGPVSDLNVGVSDVLVTALGKAIIPAASGYLMYTLGPYGALAYVGAKVGEKLLRVELPPVAFQPRSTALSAEHHDYLERVATILTDRPETDLQLCPQGPVSEFFSQDEITAIETSTVELVERDREQLLNIGQLRAAELKNYLATTFAIADDRLLICDTFLNQEKESLPKVLLQL